MAGKLIAENRAAKSWTIAPLPNPARFWARLVGGFALIFGTVDIACARGPANGDTFSECTAVVLNTPARRAAFLALWGIFAVWLPKHILKER